MHKEIFINQTTISVFMTEDPIPKELFNILACPEDKSDLRYTKNKKALQCVKCKNTYPIKDNIPILLPPEMQ